jgi:hypothetical protein
MFSLCIPTMDRFDTYLNKYLHDYLKNDMIHEIIITDENGNDIDKIKMMYPDSLKLKLFKNNIRLGPFLNKLEACNKAQNEWIVLMDSDNFAPVEYFEKAQMYINNVVGTQKNVILAPCFARPSFNYSHFSGIVFKRGHFEVNAELLMNTGNYVINKYLIESLDLTNEKNNIQYSSACDVIYFNTLLFEQLDLHLHVVSGMEYDHVVHPGSIYLQTCNNFRHFNEYVYSRFNSLK